ncbi:MAG: hypothetical protein GY884_24740 [Proteobacteria bacterium]|nr:hypothetical protein [Pseudomonadota bacterium]
MPLTLLVLVALLPFATVHAPWRLGVAGVAGVLGAVMAVRGLRRRTPSLVMLASTGGMALAALLGGLVFLPVDQARRESLQPGLAEVVGDVLAFGGVELAPLALDVGRGAQEWAISLSWVLVVLGASLVVRNSRRAARSARLLLLAGVVLVVIAAAHRLLGAPSIWWVSGIPAGAREPFFGPFVNPNHGGVFCAALAPLAFAGAARDHGNARWLQLGALVVLAIGMVLSGSRGALLAGAAGVVPFAFIVGGRQGRLGLAVAGLAGALAVAVVGPVTFLRRLSEWLVPTSLDAGQDVFTGRGDVYADAVALVGAAPWVGLGPHGFDEGFRLFKSTPTYTYTAHAHQELLQLVVEHGVVIAGIWVLSIGLAVAHGLRSAVELESDRRRFMLAGWLGTLAAVGAASIFTFPLRIGAIELMVSLALGVVLGLSPSSERGRTAGLAFVPPLLLALAAGVGGWAWFGEPPPRSLDRVALQLESRARLDAGDLDGSLEALELATRVDPTLPWVWRDLARLERRTGEFQLSRVTYGRMLWAEVPADELPEAVAEAMRGPGDPVAIATVVLPDRGDALAIGARLLEDLGELEAAEERLDRAAELDPRFGAHLGAFLLRQKRDAEALDAVVRAPGGCFALEVEGAARHRTRDLDGATARYREALGECLGDAHHSEQVRIGLARVRLDQNDPAGLDAIERLLREGSEPIRLLSILVRDAREDGDEARLRLAKERLAAARADAGVELLQDGAPDTVEGP